jgi:hypothetical protein
MIAYAKSKKPSTPRQARDDASSRQALPLAKVGLSQYVYIITSFYPVFKTLHGLSIASKIEGVEPLPERVGGDRNQQMIGRHPAPPTCCADPRPERLLSGTLEDGIIALVSLY